MLKGQCLLFVVGVDRAYRLRLFLEQFGVKTCILNPELPINSRFHIIEQFNRHVHDIIIACESGDNTATMDEEYSASRGIDFHNV
jgi:ATP-dependent RNA helicase DDX56/DBP9